MLELLTLAVSVSAAGVLCGFLAGLFGIGGGAILVPVLISVFPLIGFHPDIVAHMAVGTSLAIIVPTAIRSYQSHRSLGAGNRDLLRGWIIFVPLGVVIASLFVRGVSGDVLRLVFATVATVIAAKMLFNRDGWKLGSDLPGKPVANAVGFVIGFISTFMGIGGGNLNNLFMTSFGQPIHQAVATSAGLGVLIAVPATLGYLIAGLGNPNLPPWSLGYIHLVSAVLIIPFAMVTAPAGARFAHRLKPRTLEIAFGVFLIVVVVRMLVTIVS